MTFSYSVARTGSHPPEMKGIPIYLPFSSLPSSFFLRHHPSLPQSSFSLCPSSVSASILPSRLSFFHSGSDLCYSLQGILSFSLEKKRYAHSRPRPRPLYIDTREILYAHASFSATFSKLCRSFPTELPFSPSSTPSRTYPCPSSFCS